MESSKFPFHPHAQRNAFRRDARPQSRLFVRWNQSLRRSPQLHPAVLRLSAMVSQLFTVPLLTIQHRLRREFVQFNVCAHFLDLHGLFFHRCGESFHSGFQLRDCRFLLLVFAVLF